MRDEERTRRSLPGAIGNSIMNYNNVFSHISVYKIDLLIIMCLRVRFSKWSILMFDDSSYIEQLAEHVVCPKTGTAICSSVDKTNNKLILSISVINDREI